MMIKAGLFAGVLIETEDGGVTLSDKDGKRYSDKWGEIEVNTDILNEALDKVIEAYKGVSEWQV